MFECVYAFNLTSARIWQWQRADRSYGSRPRGGCAVSIGVLFTHTQLMLRDGTSLREAHIVAISPFDRYPWTNWLPCSDSSERKHTTFGLLESMCIREDRVCGQQHSELPYISTSYHNEEGALSPLFTFTADPSTLNPLPENRKVVFDIGDLFREISQWSHERR